MNYLYRYKYLPFTEGSSKVLTDGTIKFTCPNEFNDPFDSKPHYDPDSLDTFLDRRPEWMERVRISKGLTSQQFKTQKHECVENLKMAIESGSFWQSMISDVGVLSLSRAPLSILMWSHYADDHKGFLVEFKIPTTSVLDSEITYLEYLVPSEVKYVKVRPKLDVGERDSEKSSELHLLRKSKDWI